MATHTTSIVAPYNFSTALQLSVAERFRRSIGIAEKILRINRYADSISQPCIPSRGASAEELRKLESDLGVPLPHEYRDFLASWRYLKVEDGCEIGGLDHEGLYVCERPWISDQHRKDVPYLVFANYWRYADGDQLMFDLSDPTHPVIAYLHEHRPLYESYAPSFSTALWRLMHEQLSQLLEPQ